jgi:hypothetical protein
MTDPFELFWSAYPRRVSKAKARDAFAKARKKTTIDAMLTALEWQREQESWQQRDADGVLRYVPHPASWLNGERWDDERPVKVNTLTAVIRFPSATCGECVDGWREDDMHRVYRCPCKSVKARTA